ncbi:hypothetical protein [Actinomadura hibisca]|uniref:hypothetical protein n=1 Tax=Actinomadura hibisca TaxID=68565 RepID=UPI000829F2A7|nr:hypothetical protein [Actinomadura hibisca]
MLLLALAASAALGAATPTPSPAGLSATVGEVRCPQRQVAVTVVNDTGRARTYTLLQNDREIRTERVQADKVINGLAQLREDERTRVVVRSEGRTIASVVRTADCDSSTAPDEESGEDEGGGTGGGSDGASKDGGGENDAGGAHGGGTPDKLPHTGPGTDGSLRVLTALGGLAGGAVLLFWGWLWPGSGRGDWCSPTRRL